MKFAYSMLLDFVTTKKSAEELGELLTMAGFEVESVEDVERDRTAEIRDAVDQLRAAGQQHAVNRLEYGERPGDRDVQQSEPVDDGGDVQRGGASVRRR